MVKTGFWEAENASFHTLYHYGRDNTDAEYESYLLEKLSKG